MSAKNKHWARWRWDQLRSLGTSRVVQLTFLIPVLGYFLLFGESFNEYLRLAFSAPDADLADPGTTPSSDSSSPRISYWRVYFLYFGFCFVALASFVFAIFCPEPIKLHGAAYKFVHREEKTLSDYRIAMMRDALDRGNYETVRIGQNYPDYEQVREWVMKSDDNEYWPIPERDGEEPHSSAQDLARIKEVVRRHDDASLMTEYFVSLKRTAPRIRSLVTGLYGIGFALVAVPTTVVFLQVLVAATESFGHFLARVF